MHDCPECGMACYCSGDIEDHDTGPEYLTDCKCCLNRPAEDDEPPTPSRMFCVRCQKGPLFSWERRGLDGELCPDCQPVPDCKVTSTSEGAE